MWRTDDPEPLDQGVFHALVAVLAALAPYIHALQGCAPY